LAKHEKSKVNPHEKGIDKAEHDILPGDITESDIPQPEDLSAQEAKVIQLQKDLQVRDEQIANLRNDFQSEKEKNKELFDKYLRLQAEFENFRKRMTREKADFLKYSMENFLKELLPVVDNFELALESAKKTSDWAGFYEGVHLIYKQLSDILQKEGLTYMPSAGKPFDPLHHEAVMQVESGTHSENTIVEELKKGYYLNDRLIRPAQVAVAKRKSD